MQEEGSNKIEVANVTLRLDKPTRVKLQDLYTWVVWQFPQPTKKELPGAVHPPQPNYGWYPATINVVKGWVKIFAMVPGPYPTPEQAREHLAEFVD